MNRRIDKYRKSQIRNPKSQIAWYCGCGGLRFHGNIAAATSTGGMTNKKFGRIGDTAIIGSGTYAENATCAVSCTGHGEYFMLGATAYDVAARMKYLGLDLETSGERLDPTILRRSAARAA